MLRTGDWQEGQHLQSEIGENTGADDVSAEHRVLHGWRYATVGNEESHLTSSTIETDRPHAATGAVCLVYCPSNSGEQKKNNVTLPRDADPELETCRSSDDWSRARSSVFLGPRPRVNCLAEASIDIYGATIAEAAWAGRAIVTEPLDIERT